MAFLLTEAPPSSQLTTVSANLRTLPNASSQVFTCEINRNEYGEKGFGGKEALADTHEMMIKTRRGRRESGEGRRRAEDGGRPGESKEN